MTFQALLSKHLEGVCTLSESELSLMEGHYQLLLRWNKKVNLTTVVELEEAVTRHYCESVFVAMHLPLEQALRVADVGSGAGFPGIPIAITRTHCQVDLIESRQRKAAFLREACRNLSNVRVVARRAEECPAEYEWMVSRAVALSDLSKLRLASHAALLIGEGDIGETARLAGFRWQEPVRLPWGDKRFLLVGELCST